MSVERWHAGLFEAAARQLDRDLRARACGETYRPSYLRDHAARLEELSTAIETGIEVRGPLAWAKGLVKRALRPYLVRQERLDRKILERLIDLTDSVRQTAAALDGLREEMREEFDDQEMRLRAAPRRAAPAAGVTGSGRLRVAGDDSPFVVPDGTRLFLGAAPVPHAGYLRVDPDGAEADVRAPLDAIPARQGSVAEIVVANVLEDFSVGEVTDVLLPHWAALLRPGAPITFVAEDLDAAVERLREGRIDAEGLAQALFGDGGRARRSAFTPGQLRRLAEGAGLVRVGVARRVERPDAGAFGFEMRAWAPAA